MNGVKKVIMTAALFAVVLSGSMTAKADWEMVATSGVENSQTPCMQQEDVIGAEKYELGGVIVTLTGVIVTLTGVDLGFGNENCR